LMLTTLAIPVLASICLPIALAIKFESNGPLFYEQIRGGYQSQRFRLYKFRTMFHRHVAGKMVQATTNDPRITRVGKIRLSSELCGKVVMPGSYSRRG